LSEAQGKRGTVIIKLPVTLFNKIIADSSIRQPRYGYT
jgi:hypothetical protein